MMTVATAGYRKAAPVAESKAVPIAPKPVPAAITLPATPACARALLVTSDLELASIAPLEKRN